MRASAILTGAGGNFCAGADLSGTRDSAPGDGDAPALPPNNVYAMRVLGDVVLAVHDCPIPVVAKVDGVCVGAGLGLALAADMTGVPRPRALLGDLRQARAEPRLRDVMVAASTDRRCTRPRSSRSPRGCSAARKRSSSGSSTRPFRPTSSMQPSARSSDSIAAGPPIALSMAKRELDNAATTSLAQALEVEALAQSVNVHTEDLREALTAYVERRTPDFTGR